MFQFENRLFGWPKTYHANLVNLNRGIISKIKNGIQIRINRFRSAKMLYMKFNLLRNINEIILLNRILGNALQTCSDHGIL